AVIRDAHLRRAGPAARRGDPPPDRRERRGGVRAVTIVPRKSLGQHFLVDDNILGVIGRLAELAPEDIVLEIGPGLGVLTRYLAARVARVHAVELDTSLEPHLRNAGDNVVLQFGDAVRLDLHAVAPDATKLVANLPYN